MGFIRKEIGEREKKLLEDFSIEEKELALPFLLEDEKRGIFLCVKQFRIGEGKYQVLAMILGGHLLEFRLEEERADRYPARNEEAALTGRARTPVRCIHDNWRNDHLRFDPLLPGPHGHRACRLRLFAGKRRQH